MTTNVEVVEIGSGDQVVLAFEPDDPLQGAEIISVSSQSLPGEFAGESFTYNQTTQSNIWLIVHPLPFTPSGIRVVNSAGARMYPTRESYPATGRVRLDFTRPVSGTAYLS